MEFIPQMEPWFGSEEKTAICNYMDEGGWLTEFKHTQEFENRIAEYTGAKHCIVVNNGTISLTLMAMAAGIKHGDEVIVPNYTMIATPNSVKMIGATPVFVDVESETLCMDFEKMKAAINEKTKDTDGIMLSNPKKNTMFSKDEGKEMKTMKKSIRNNTEVAPTKPDTDTDTKEKDKGKDRKNPFQPKHNPKPKAKKEFKEQTTAPTKPDTDTDTDTKEKDKGRKNPFQPKHNPAPKAGKGSLPNFLMWNKLGVNLK
jgi:outer membrane biosynthesis protein TonB